MDKTSLLVIGCGDIGGAVAEQLASAGWDVSGVRRQAQPRPGVNMIAADITDPSKLTALRELAPAYVLFVLTPGDYSDERYRSVYVDGAQNCFAYLNTQNLRHVFWVSSTSVYHQDDGSTLDETSPALPSGFAGRRLLEAEALIRDGGFAHTIVRFGGIYGPGRERLLRQLRAGTRSPQWPPRYSNRIHRDDAVAILQFLLQRAATGAEVAQLYLGVDAEPTALADVERWFSGYLRLDYARMIEQDGEQRGGNRRCSSLLLQAAGYRFLYPSFREGLPTLLGPANN